MAYASHDQPIGNADKLDGHDATEFLLLTNERLLTELGEPLMTENNLYIKIET